MKLVFQIPIFILLCLLSWISAVIEGIGDLFHSIHRVFDIFVVFSLRKTGTDKWLIAYFEKRSKKKKVKKY